MKKYIIIEEKLLKILLNLFIYFGYLFDHRSKRVANRIILLFIPKLIVVLVLPFIISTYSTSFIMDLHVFKYL